MVGRVSRMRVSSMTRPSSSGTLKSTRMKIRLPLSGRSRMDSLDMTGRPLSGSIRKRAKRAIPASQRARRIARLAQVLRREKCARLRMTNISQALTGNVVDQVADAAGVSPLIVVPGDDLDAVAPDHQGHGRIHD